MRVDLQKLLDYIENDEAHFGSECFDTTKNELDKMFTMRYLKEAFKRFAEENEKYACAPNYEAMYNNAVNEKRILQDRIDYLETLNHNYCLEMAHYKGAVSAIELLCGRKMDFRESGSTPMTLED